MSPTATGTSIFSAGAAGAEGDGVTSFAVETAEAVGVLPLSMIVNKSLRVIRPSSPDPSTSDKSMPLS